MAAPAVAELRAVDLHEHGVDGPVAGALRGGARRLHVAHDDHRERDDEPEEDQAPIHATDCTPRIAAMSEPTKYLLGEEQIPTHWINLLGDLPGEPLPPLNPGTGQPAGPDDLTPIFPMALIAQEVSPEPEVEIPADVRDAYGLWRPTPLYRARRLEKALNTSARIYYKYEGGSPSGSHKPNTAVPQAYENAKAGVKKLSTETGAGQWGSSLAFACSLFGLDCEVFMVGSSYDQKPYRRSMMEAWGATVHRSPSDRTQSGQAAGSSTPPARSGSRSRRPSRSPPRTPTATTRSARCSTTCSCTRP